ncbi:cytochrome c biogenesis protein ResB [Serpentinicella alkaliphila]|uniref:Cytochrome c biogenesis protein n=1 Tax=Serpentinicella alkaliphila TaxID=1734049 RepID=A0A4R2TVK4_9FIRM|nr:cytochrome c biogenesis protein ResB [Serpentinicella alkaliphila]QUH26797.1 cytochrome c biogenesis protein ResB [Serpentinicella alkaliphila]TCQ08018.1 cytochrome c biogenesis protein [Serpentinicella alkaliphila]
MKKIINYLKSMKFGLMLLFYLVILSFIGSMVPQGRDEIFYSRLYSERVVNMIMLSKADDIYHSFYFLIGAVALSVNLFLCSIFRINSIVKTIYSIPDYKVLTKYKSKEFTALKDDKKIKDFMTEIGFKNYNIHEAKGEKLYYGRRNRIGYLGSWVIHLGVFLVIAFYTYGQYTYFSTAVYGVPASSQVLEGTDIDVKIHDFKIEYRDDGSISQYISNIELVKDEETVLWKDVFVNNPLRYNGYAFYQTSTGWATDFEIHKGDELLKKDIFYEGTAIIEEKEGIVIQFAKFYPDFDMRGRFVSLSNDLNNPFILYTVFYNGHRVAMNVAEAGESIEWHQYTFKFSNPQRYTYLQVNKMKGKVGAMFGSALILIGLIICFYFKPKELVIRREQNKLQVYGKNMIVDI